MLFSNTLLIAAASALLAEASPLEKRDSCTLSGKTAGGGLSNCATVTVNNVEVPSGKTLDLTGLQDGATVNFVGQVTFDYDEWVGPLVSISGKNIKVVGKSGHLLDGDGARWWDGKGDSGKKVKPKFMSLKLTGNSDVGGLQIKNTPIQAISVNSCSDTVIHDVTIDNSDGDKDSLGHNTDGFDVGNVNNVTIENCHVYNQDDCIAVNSGTGVYFKNNYCSGGHGASIGSVGLRSNNVVDTVYFENNQIVNSDNGLRIKTIQKATGSVNNVHFLSNTISGIRKFGIVVETDYSSGSTTGTPGSKVPITNFEVDGLTGSVDSSAYRVKILVAGASKWTWKDVDITGGSSFGSCTGIPSGSGASC